MIIRHKNEGTYVDYALRGTALTFGSNTLTVDLSEQARDWPVSLDISAEENGHLVLGPSFRYIAQVEIPERSHAILKGVADDFGFPQLSRVTAPLDMGKVVLTLWDLGA